MSAAGEPRTEAGRRLHLERHARRFHHARLDPSCGLAQDILAIEAEAARQTEPRLDVERLTYAIASTGALQELLYKRLMNARRIEHRHIRRFVEAIAAAYEAAANEEGAS